jgi:N-acetylglucosamine malate deacetylase 1
MTQHVLVIAPHPDDESIGCGGTIRLHRERGDKVRVVFLTSGELGIPDTSLERARAIREAEATEALGILGVAKMDFLRLPDMGVLRHLDEGVERFARILDAEKPGIIYLPHHAEAHPDHGAALPLIRSALRHIDDGRAALKLRGYEVWTPLMNHDWAEIITPHMATKLRAVRCYQSQLSQFRYDRAVRGLNQYRGCLAARTRYAEVFLHLSPTQSQKLEARA